LLAKILGICGLLVQRSKSGDKSPHSKFRAPWTLKEFFSSLLGFTLLLAIGAGSSTTGHALYRNNDQDRRGQNDGYGNYGGSYELRQTALNAGYNEGIKQGHKDRNSRNGYGFQGQSAYVCGGSCWSAGNGQSQGLAPPRLPDDLEKLSGTLSD
jgi:hypothetical protein